MNAQQSEHGMTLIELMVALAILAFGLLALLAATSQALNFTMRSRDMITVENGVRALVERMYAQAETQGDFDRLFQAYRNRVDTIPLSPGGDQVASVRYEFPVDEGGRLIEDPAGLPAPLAQRAADLGLPMDIDLDGDTNDSMTNGYKLLPVRVVAEWRTTGSTGRYSVHTLLTWRGN